MIPDRLEKIALIGSHPNSRMLAPFHDPSWSIWACSPTNAGKFPRTDLWFELHGDLEWPEYREAWAYDYCLWLQNQQFPVFAINQRSIPRAMTFPKDEMIRLYGRRHFTSSFAWMIAYAMTKEPKEIGLFGIDMNTEAEYTKQRQGFQHFMDIAESRGIILRAPDESDILQPPPLYGYDRTTAFVRKISLRKAEYLESLEKYRVKRDEAIQQIAHLRGAIEEIDYMETIWGAAHDGWHLSETQWYGTPEVKMVEVDSLDHQRAVTNAVCTVGVGVEHLDPPHTTSKKRTSLSEKNPNGQLRSP